MLGCIFNPKSLNTFPKAVPVNLCGQPNRSRGFTLVELLVVVAIIAILTFISLVNYGRIEYRARVAQALGDMKVIQTALEAYRVDHGKLPPDIEGFIPFFLTDSLSIPTPYLTNNRGMVDPFNNFAPSPPQWRLNTYRYINLAARVRNEPGLANPRPPGDWLPISAAMWEDAYRQFGDYYIGVTDIKFKDNFERDESGRVKAMKKWNDFFVKEDGDLPKFMEKKKSPFVSQKEAWSGLAVQVEGEGGVGE